MKQNNEIALKTPIKKRRALSLKLDEKFLTWKEWLCYLSYMLCHIVIPKENKNRVFFIHGLSSFEKSALMTGTTIFMKSLPS